MSTSFLIIAFVAIQVISGAFSMFGKGGGSLYTPVLVMLGMAVAPAISTALFLNLVTALTATIVFQRNKLLDCRFCLVFLPGANSLIVTVTSLVGTVGRFVLGHVDYRFLTAATVACILGSAVGSHVTVKASPGFVRIAFACIMWFFATPIALKLMGIL